jgi:hypothetical protein
MSERIQKLKVYANRNCAHNYTKNVYRLITNLLAESAQCYCGEIRLMLTFLIKCSCLQGYHRPDYSIRIVEYHMKNHYP